jgi:hypothetical protein
MSIVLFLLGVATFIVRYKGQAGQLIQVLCWNGGAYYGSLLGWSSQFLPVFVRLTLPKLRKTAVRMTFLIITAVMSVRHEGHEQSMFMLTSHSGLASSELCPIYVRTPTYLLCELYH